MLGLSRDLLDKWFRRRTGVPIGAVEEVVLRSAHLHAFKVWLAAGRNGVASLRDEEVWLLARLLEGAQPGCFSEFVPEAESDRERVAALGADPVAVPSPDSDSAPATLASANSLAAKNGDLLAQIQRENWTLLGAVAEALDYSARDCETEEELCQGMLQSPLRIVWQTILRQETAEEGA